MLKAVVHHGFATLFVRVLRGLPTFPPTPRGNFPPGTSISPRGNGVKKKRLALTPRYFNFVPLGPPATQTPQLTFCMQHVKYYDRKTWRAGLPSHSQKIKVLELFCVRFRVWETRKMCSMKCAPVCGHAFMVFDKYLVYAFGTKK